GRLVLLRRGEREGAGRGLGRGEAADVAGGPGGLGDPGIARLGHPAGLEGQGPQDGGASDRLSGAEPRAAEVRRVSRRRLSDREWGGGRGVSSPGEGSVGTGRDAVASPGGAGDAGPSSDLPQRRVGGVLDLPCGEGRPPALWESPEGWIR